MIKLENVSKAYRLKGMRKQVIRNFNFVFPAGRNVAILGPNGAGKSTLLRLISGAEQPDEGRILRRCRVSWPMGFSGGFNGTMTGLENIRFVARIYGADTDSIIEQVQEFAELGPSLRLPIRTYSSGMRARLAFGLSLAIDFNCYLIDEITAVGDENFRRKSLAAFRSKLSRAQVIMISHSMPQIREFCDCGLLLTPDGIRYHDSVEGLVKDYQSVAG